MPDDKVSPEFTKNPSSRLTNLHSHVRMDLGPASVADAIYRQLQAIEVEEPKIVSIEYAHIYADDLPNIEQKLSVECTREVCDRFRTLGVKVRLEVFVDDYNTTQNTLDVTDIQEFLQSAGLEPQFIASESALVESATALLDEAGRAGAGGRQFLQKRGRVPCSALIAAWYLARLNLIDSKSLLLAGTLDAWRSSVPQILLSVLPDYYQGVEEQARRLLGSARSDLALDRISTFYFPSVQSEASDLRAIELE
jgi:hypothetical protein